MRTAALRTPLLLLAIAHAGCRHSGAAEPAAPTAGQPKSDRAAATAGAAALQPAADQTAAAPAAPEPAPAAEIVFDLARSVERAELRRGRELLIDYGHAGADKYTLGGWLTGASDSRVLDEASCLIVGGKVVKLLLPAEAAGAARLTMRLRGLRPGPLTVHINGAKVSDLALGGRDFDRFELPLPAGLLKPGENLLQLRVVRTGSARGVPKAGLAIDWIALGPGAGAEGAQAELSPPALTDLLDGEPGAGRLRIPAGHSLAYSFEVPKGAELRGLLRAGDGAKPGAELGLLVERDGAPPQPLGGQAAVEAERPLRHSLAQYAGQIVRLTLSAKAGDVVLKAPALVVPARGAARKQPPPVKNVVVVLVDTLRADKLSPYSPETRVKTPGLTTFLKTAAVMKNARTQENWTKPSVATLLSSLLPWEHNAVTGDAKVPQSVELLPELLRKRGFYTGSFIANGYVSDKFGFKQGWHTYRNYIREGRRTKAQYVAADVLDWLDSRPKDKPFLLYMHTIDPHVPYRPPTSFVSMYDEPYSGKVDFSNTATLLEKIKVGSVALQDRDKRYLEALYDAEISYHDVHFAAVMEGLEKRGLADETMVVVTADHGEEFWDHGSVGHGHSVYDELLHVPLIVRIPGLTEGKQVVEDSVGLVDVMPTILEALGQEVPEHLSGRSFLPELRGQRPSAPRTAVSGFMTGWRTLSVGRLKFIQRTLKDVWLYDVESDPSEKKDLAESHPIALRYARGMLGLTLAEQERGSQPSQAQPSEAKPRAPKRKHRQEKTTIDAETEAQLRALGYVGAAAPGASGQ
ncbi:MAG: sulfatase-like hydrolase/transferase [Myxococcales bacterium]|nr:sulfatase-like hydrolase/transferase [Myxococcales bacterium]